MKKIPSIFERDWDGDRSRVVDKRNPECEWVFKGEGQATKKLDGSACMIRDNKLYARYDAKHGKTQPEGFEPTQEPDPITGHYPGWVPVKDQNVYCWQLVAFLRSSLFRCVNSEGNLSDGTYEAIGPHFQGNPENYPVDVLVPHGIFRYKNVPTDFDQLVEWLKTNLNGEGLVWHHPDGRMAKIKKSDFGLKRND